MITPISKSKNKKDYSHPHFERESNLLKCKCSQHETMGFVLIILIVVIAGVIFLGISLRTTDNTSVIDSRISNFLDASLQHTTACYGSYESDYQTLGELINSCSAGTLYSATCPNSDACDFANKTYSVMLSKFSSAGSIKSYKLSFYYSQNSSSKIEDLVQTTSAFKTFSSELSDKKGCLSKRAGYSFLRSESSEGNIYAYLEICLE